MTDEHWVATEPSPRHVRAVVNGVAVADSKRVLLLRERGHVAFYWDKVDQWFEEDEEVFSSPD